MDLVQIYENYEVSDGSEDDDDNIERGPRQIRLRPDNYNIWNNLEFFNRFRLSKESVRRIYDIIFDDIKTKTNWNNALSPINALLLTIRYLATGNFLITVGDFAGVHKTTAGKWIWIVLQAIAHQRRQFIKFPSTVNELKNNKLLFYRKARFPNVIGAIDCTHIKIQSVGGDNAELYRNRKGFFSFNVQTICDANLKILDVVARWPGSAHDSTIFNNSNIRARFERGEFRNCVIVGDSGYQNRAYCLTPIQNPVTPAEQLYCEAHVRTRNVIERSYGVWKRRFPILARGLQLNIEKVQCLIVATAILHNIAIENNDENPPQLDQDLEAEINLTNNVPIAHVQQRINEHNRTRLQVVQYFSTLIN